ncbi:hypothetical protein [Teichococcus vastitatis]|uniref:DUF2384 domain-containing protein n=1 Tax=Teichococcus vastitatis TaxID=2307076 RepID=A0ABS9W2P6_9PROT|nr:hypothetical protein [Pseudoroseomonas vastitatis]MCI0753574.1 hypothetical protein [Pseudoroseomonas vastitatis]
MADCLSRHVAQACASADLKIKDLWAVLDDADQGVIWGAAFEDLLASDLPDGRNLADDYLKRRGWKEPVATRNYIAALRRAVISLYEVSEVVPGESMLLRNLVRPSEPVRVLERSGTRNLYQWDRIATRVVPLRSGTVISGTLLAFDKAATEKLLATLRPTRRKAGKPAAEAPPEPGHAASAFTNLWLASVLRSEGEEARPEIRNSDGDPLELITLHFPLRPGTALDAVCAALTAVPTLRQASATFWNWLAPANDSAMGSARTKTGLHLITTMDDGVAVLGSVEITGRKVSLSVNSSSRAERGHALLKVVLQGLVRPPLMERQDLDRMLVEQHAPGQEPPFSGLSPEQEREIIQQQLEEHYRGLLDEPIPPLGNVSPRRAARTAKGREKVVAWLKTLENHSAKRIAGDPIGEYDFAWMWRELGVAELRK